MDLDDIDNIDEFLDQIEEDARKSSRARLNTDFDLDYFDTPKPSQPQRNQSPSISQPPRAQNATPQRAAAPSNSQPIRPVPAQQQRSPTQSQLANNRDGEAELQAQGYEKHNNKGKWINYQGGKATDFRIRGTTSTRLGLSHAITLRALDDFGNPAKIDNPREFIGCILTHVQSGSDLPCWYRDNGNCEYDLAFCAQRPGSVRMEIKLAGNPMFDLEIQVEDVGTSVWAAKPRLPAKPKELFVVDIETIDGSRPEGVTPFEVQTVGSVENLRLINNGDGTYRFQCVPQSHGHVTIQLSLHGQPIKNSPVTVQVGDRQPVKVRQESPYVETISDTRPVQQRQQEAAGYDQYVEEEDESSYNPRGSYQPRESHTDVSNDDLNRLLDELGG